MRGSVAEGDCNRKGSPTHLEPTCEASIPRLRINSTRSHILIYASANQLYLCPLVFRDLVSPRGAKTPSNAFGHFNNDGHRRYPRWLAISLLTSSWTTIDSLIETARQRHAAEAQIAALALEEPERAPQQRLGAQNVLILFELAAVQRALAAAVELPERAVGRLDEADVVQVDVVLRVGRLGVALRGGVVVRLG